MSSSVNSLLPATPTRYHSPITSPSMSPSARKPTLTPRVKTLVMVLALSQQAEVVDKLLKLVQYCARFLIAFSGKGQWLHSVVNETRANAFQKAISGTRKVIRLGRCFRYVPILRVGISNWDVWNCLEYWNTAVGMVNDTLDDIGWAASLDLLSNSKEVGDWASKWAQTIWFYNASADFLITCRRWWVATHKLRQKPENEELKEKVFAEEIYVYRFAADVLQSSDPIFNWGLHKGVIGTTGIISALGSLARIYMKEYSAQAKKIDIESQKIADQKMS